MAITGLGCRPARAASAAFEKAVKRLIGNRTPVKGRILVDLPSITEDGANVLVGVEVDSPMTEADHVTALHLLATENPNVEIASFRLTPQVGRASVIMRVRLATSQALFAVAEMSDGTIYMDGKFTKVTIGGCGGAN